VIDSGAGISEVDQLIVQGKLEQFNQGILQGGGYYDNINIYYLRIIF